MGLLTMNEAEYEYYVDNIKEAFELIGQEATLYEVDTEVKDLYQDWDLTHKDGKEISLIFEANPKPIIKKFNWVTESDENPLVANIVAKANDGTIIEVRVNMLIKLKSQYGLKAEKLFRVSHVVGSSIDPLTYICKLVPYHYKADIDVETPGYQEIRDHDNKDTDFSYLRTKL